MWRARPWRPPWYRISRVSDYYISRCSYFRFRSILRRFFVSSLSPGHVLNLRKLWTHTARVPLVSRSVFVSTPLSESMEGGGVGWEGVHPRKDGDNFRSDRKDPEAYFHRSFLRKLRREKFHTGHKTPIFTYAHVRVRWAGVRVIWSNTLRRKHEVEGGRGIT